MNGSTQQSFSATVAARFRCRQSNGRACEEVIRWHGREEREPTVAAFFPRALTRRLPALSLRRITTLHAG
jgi:hypothetical protein